MIDNQKISWGFFGTSRFSVIVLEELKSKGLLPKIIITAEDKPKGRKLLLTPPEVKVWAEKNNIPVFQPNKLNEEFASKLSDLNIELFIVASYGKIIPQNILELPKYKTLNIHPSLLPKLRGASPIQSAILTENETGVTIIKLDREMDHGPILTQNKIDINPWPTYANDLEETLAESGAKMLIDILPKWIGGEIKEIDQDHSKATFCKKIKKSDAEIDLKDSPILNLRKIYAYHSWPGAHYFVDQKRIIIKNAHIENDELVIDRVVPEGKKEMDYKDFIRNNPKTNE